MVNDEGGHPHVPGTWQKGKAGGAWGRKGKLPMTQIPKTGMGM